MIGQFVWDGSVNLSTVVAVAILSGTIIGATWKILGRLIKGEMRLEAIGTTVSAMAPKVEEIRVHAEKLASGEDRMDKFEDRLLRVEGHSRR